MLFNTASQHQGVVAWTALAVPSERAVDLRQHVNFGLTFRVDTDIAVDAVFHVRSNGANPADPCEVDDVGNYEDIPGIVTCGPWGVSPPTQSVVTIPAGTPGGTICTATLPCKPDAFIRVFPVSGDTGKVEVVVTLSGPR